MPRVRGILAVTFLVASCAACSGTAGESAPNSPTSSTSAPSMPAPTSSVPPYLASYSIDQRVAFNDAVDALHRFTTVNDRFLGEGELTKRQAAFYRKHSVDWVGDWATLSQFVNNKVTYEGSPIEVWLRPLSIDLTAKDGQLVRVRRCLDESQLVVFADGEEIAQPQLKNPHVYKVSMIRRPGESWWRVGLPRQGNAC
jgi:hypothetical protein